MTAGRLERKASSAQTSAVIEGMLGQHPRIVDRALPLQLDEFLSRLTRFLNHRVPGYRNYRTLRQELIERERAKLRIDEFMPRVMSAFVRNRLINEVYLPLIGDNLAKQMGSVGEGKRTDLMGMLLLISPPGYGKTTLMEYLANRLGPRLHEDQRSGAGPFGDVTRSRPKRPTRLLPRRSRSSISPSRWATT